MIKIRFEYWCDFCHAEIVGADVFQHGADYGRYPVPRHVQRVKNSHACATCSDKAEVLLLRELKIEAAA